MCKERVGIRKEAVTAHVMFKISKQKKKKSPAEVFSDADEIRSHDTCRKTLCKTSKVFFMARK
jgi:hypothetical protein